MACFSVPCARVSNSCLFEAVPHTASGLTFRVRILGLKGVPVVRDIGFERVDWIVKVTKIMAMHSTSYVVIASRPTSATAEHAILGECLASALSTNNAAFLKKS